MHRPGRTTWRSRRSSSRERTSSPRSRKPTRSSSDSSTRASTARDPKAIMTTTGLAPRDEVALPRARRRAGPVRRRERQGILYVLPAVALTLLFFIIPLLGTIWTSLRRQPLYGPGEFIGLLNYVNAFQDPVFWGAVWFTFRF